MDLETFTHKVFEYFAWKIYYQELDGDDWRLIKGKRSKEAIKQFTETMLEMHGAAAGPGFVWYYTIYQFDRFKIKQFRPDNKGNFITPVMVYGKTGMEKFGNRKTIDALMLQSSWLKEHKISQAEFVEKHKFTFTTGMEKVDLDKVESKLQSYRDPIKKITATTYAGPDSCYDFTDMYNDKDPSCRKCPYEVECKQKLKEVNPRLYTLRNYE